MTSALEHPIGPTTVDQWLRLDPPPDGSRLELLYGHLHVIPPPTGEHQYATVKLLALLEKAISAAGRTDLYQVPAVGLEISTPWRTGVIPDVVVLCGKPIGASFEAEQVALIVEIWSPGNRRADREDKKSAYAAAGVPCFWEIENGRISAHYLENGRYVREVWATPGNPVTIRRAAPVPVTFDPADLVL
ncbi:MAG TPA: Uma2 family endonuclease [Actinophytocola sp.]|uniref:Uma2 family endonuclease n=1 Tax=Actinophytocola sp. TaxID=1872138 RepID=UPI002DB63B7A|nr:Uma2 family endonuclease [Actinophytocola sp.]HEU5475017.1 Uma2 family endonuclease [Actinophytocola sp.]